jgi:hypothetical protein
MPPAIRLVIVVWPASMKKMRHRRDESGLASGLITTQRAGGALGLAVLQPWPARAPTAWPAGSGRRLP